MKLKEFLDGYNPDGSEHYMIEIQTDDNSLFKWHFDYPLVALSENLLNTEINCWGVNDREREIFIVLEKMEVEK